MECAVVASQDNTDQRLDALEHALEQAKASADARAARLAQLAFQVDQLAKQPLVDERIRADLGVVEVRLAAVEASMKDQPEKQHRRFMDILSTSGCLLTAISVGCSLFMALVGVIGLVVTVLAVHH